MCIEAVLSLLMFLGLNRDQFIFDFSSKKIVFSGFFFAMSSSSRVDFLRSNRALSELDFFNLLQETGKYKKRSEITHDTVHKPPFIPATCHPDPMSSPR